MTTQESPGKVHEYDKRIFLLNTFCDHVFEQQFFFGNWSLHHVTSSCPC